MKKIFCFLLCVILIVTTHLSALASVDVNSFEETEDSVLLSDYDNGAGALKKVKVQKTGTEDEFNDAVEEMVKNDSVDNFYSEIVIDKDENTITKDSQDAVSLNEYDVDCSEDNIGVCALPAEAVLDALGVENDVNAATGDVTVEGDSGEKVIEGYVKEEDEETETVYVDSVALNENLAVQTQEEGNKITITSPYQTKRLLVKTKTRKALKSRYVAQKAVCDSDGLYVLQFEDEVQTRNAYALFKADPSVEYVKIDSVYSVSALSEREGAKTIQSDKYKSYLRKQGKTDTVIVAVVDTGVDSDHEFLKSRIIKKGYNAYAGNTNWEDDNGHGTHVSGIIVDNSPSNVKILPIKVIGANGVGSGLAVKLGIEKAVKYGADVINMSLGAACDHEDCPIEKAVLSAIKKGVTVVAAAGNDTDDTKRYCPASLTQCITVASTSKDGSLISSFSNYGSSVDIAAPGEDILSCRKGGGYVTMSGTSMATPFVAAAAAMVLTNKPTLTPAQVEKTVSSYTLDMFTEGKDISSGSGILNLGVALGEKVVNADEIYCPDNNFNIIYYGVSVKYYMSISVSSSDEENVMVDRSFSVTIDDPSLVSFTGCILTPKKAGTTYVTLKLKNNEKFKFKVKIKNSGTWLDVAAKSYAGGKGTIKDPYLISTPEQLAKFSLDSLLNNERYSYKLTKDIDLKGRTWVSACYYQYDAALRIGDYDEVVFNGNNHKIKNMTVYKGGYSCSSWYLESPVLESQIQNNRGFIESIHNATLKNLGLDNAYSEVRDSGLLCGNVFENTKISNCYTSGFTFGNGLFGDIFNYAVSISNCYSSATVCGNGISYNILSSGVSGGVVLNNVFFCGEQLPNHFKEENSGFSYNISSFKNGTALYNCFCAGQALSKVGFAQTAENSTISKCYYLDKNTMGIKNKVKLNENTLSPKAVSFFKNAKTYSSTSYWNEKYKWDFNKVWAIDGKTNGGFPYLKNNKPNTVKAKSTNTWMDYAASSYGGGSGTEKNPYLISTAEQLALISKQYRYGGGENVYFKLTANIDLSAHNWLPIGSGYNINSVYDKDLNILNYDDEAITKYFFYGNIDGNGKTVKGLKIVSNGDYIGFIAINENNVVKNLKFKDVSVKGRHGCGVVAGYNRVNAKIINCSVSGTVDGNTKETLGGICGKNYASAKIVGCSAKTVLCYDNHGIISRCFNPAGLATESDGIISDCYTKGNIPGSVIYHSYREYKKKGVACADIYDEVYGKINKIRTVSPEELTKKSTFSSWDFKTVWAMNSDKNNSKPYILSQSKYTYETLPTSKWESVATTKFAGGKGTKSNPWLIATPEQLAGAKKYINENSNNLCFRLIKNIDLSGKLWDSQKKSGYSGKLLVFDGNGKTITGMTTCNGAGLFDISLAEDGVIRNLNMKDFHGTAICALVSLNSGTIKNCNIQCYNISGYEMCGTITESNSGTIEKCEIDVCGFSSTSMSGISGYNSGSIKNCSVKGFMHGESVYPISPLRVDTAFVNCYTVAANGGYDYTSLAGDPKNKNCHEATEFTNIIYTDESERAEDLKKKSTFVSWDFKNIWNINPNKNDGYPYIRKPIQRKIKYVLNGGKNLKYVQTDYIPGNVFTPQTPTKTYKKFAGWYTDANFKDKVTTLGKTDVGDVTLYAKWEDIVYSVKFNANGGSGTMKTQTGFVQGNAKALSKCTFKAPSGKVFAGWATSKNGKVAYTDGQKIKSVELNGKSTVTLYAVWVKSGTFKITYKLNDGKITGEYATKYRSGKGASLPVPVKKGYTFVGWYSDGKLTKKVSKIPTYYAKDITLYAKWTPITYSVKFYCTSGSGTMKTQTGFKYSKEKALSKCTFTAPKGKVFAGWATSENGKAVYTNGQKVKNLTTVDKKTVKLYAVWITPKTYTVSYSTNGGTLPKNASKSYKSGTGCSLPVPTKKGYKFAGWYTDKNLKTGKVTTVKPWYKGNLKLYAKWKKA